MRGLLRRRAEKRHLEQLLSLSLSEDEERIREGLAELPEYWCYDLAYGWPHVHEWQEERVGRKLVAGAHDAGFHHGVYALECACGALKVELRIERHRREVVRVCPYCGSQELRHKKEVDTGFNVEECLGCGHIELYDFFVTEVQDKCSSWTYHTEYQQPPYPQP